MFAMLRRGLLGLFIATVAGIVLCAVFIFASFTGFSVPRSAWADGWLPIQVETEVPGTLRRRVARFASLDRAVAKAGPGDTVTVLTSIRIDEPIPIDKDLSIVIGQGCDVQGKVGEGQPAFIVEPSCRSFQLTAGSASRIAFDSPSSGGLLAVTPSLLAGSIDVRGVGIHDASLAGGAALFDLGARPVALSLEDADVFNLNAPVIQTRAAARANIAITASRLERIKGDVAVDLSASPASTLVVADSVLIGSLGCDLVRMTRPNALICGNSYLSALGAKAIGFGSFASSAAGVESPAAAMRITA